ncbi:MAG TPA: spore maturation protein [Acetivibrio sp.]|jgi:spore maturation protein B|nr:spore maturation protein [Clostridium sp.]HOQ36500.1 spore maturation protein [Acetivibrio sp.]HPT90807.1 spore maturation protein [Acetivibrio sp.]HQA56663.1 spore maturation protein [Acetivibrio sp.]
MNIVKELSIYAIPAIFLIILCVGMYKEIKVYDVFIEGAKEGITTVLKIIPSLVGLMVAVGVFRASGALDLLVFAFKPVTNILRIPPDAVPMIFLRPISGSASLAMLSDIFKVHGPDSFVGRVASTLMGSTETIFYTLAVYFGAVGIKKIRYTLVAALIADLASVIAAVWICTVVFG